MRPRILVFTLCLFLTPVFAGEPRPTTGATPSNLPAPVSAATAAVSTATAPAVPTVPPTASAPVVAPLDLDPTPVEIPSTRAAYLGTIGTSSRFLLTLDGDEKKLAGTLRYLKTGGELLIEGGCDKKRQFRLTESVVTDSRKNPDQKRVTGLLIGQFSPDRSSATGSWQSPDHKRTLALTMHRAAVYKTIKSKVPATITYPQFVDPELVHFNPLIRSATHETYPTIAENVATNIRDFPDDATATLELRNAINSERTVDVVYVDSTLLNLFATEQNYMGGAHGMTSFAALTLGANPAPAGTPPEDRAVRVLRATDLFGRDPETYAAISQYLVADLRRQEASSVVNGSIGSFTADLMAGKCCVSLTGAALIYHFEPYCVGCYAEGSFAVSVPYRVFTKTLPATSPLQRFIAK